MPKSQQENLGRLRSEIDLAQGDVRAAVRSYTGDSITALADRAGIGRKDADMCLGRSYGRIYPGARRAIEVVLDIPQYALDDILGGGEDGDD
jgi:hypothetical protein